MTPCRLGLLVVALAATAGASSAQLIGTYPVPATPVGNPPNAQMARLGKALFHDEQLSFTQTKACFSCHFNKDGGATGGIPNGGLDGQFNTPDDNFGAPGVIRTDINGNYVNDPIFGVGQQATFLNPPSQIGAAFFSRLFWDQRAGPNFKTLGGATIPGFATNAALEDQAVGPEVSAVEMGHDGIVWSEVEAFLPGKRILALASGIPASLTPLTTLTYQQEFQTVFGAGTPTVSRQRIGMALASYMRTLIPNQAPIDGGLNALSPSQLAGFNLFRNTGCGVCHSVGNLATNAAGQFVNPNDHLFADGTAHNIGLVGHNTSVRTPSLRNVALRPRIFSTGQAAGLLDSLNQHFFVKAPPFGFGGVLNPTQTQNLLAFFGALTDPRVANDLPPFDRPILRSETNPIGSNHFGNGSSGLGGFIPTMIANAPARIANNEFKLGVGKAFGGAAATLFMSTAALPNQNIGGVPVHIDLSQAISAGTVTLSGNGPGVGTGTVKIPVPNDPGLIGVQFFFQWAVADPGAVGGLAASSAAKHTIF